MACGQAARCGKTLFETLVTGSRALPNLQPVLVSMGVLWRRFVTLI